MSMALLLEKEEERPPRQLSPGSALCMLPVPECRAGDGGARAGRGAKPRGAAEVLSPSDWDSPRVTQLQPRQG